MERFVNKDTHCSIIYTSENSDIMAYVKWMIM